MQREVHSQDLGCGLAVQRAAGHKGPWSWKEDCPVSTVSAESTQMASGMIPPQARTTGIMCLMSGKVILFQVAPTQTTEAQSNLPLLQQPIRTYNAAYHNFCSGAIVLCSSYPSSASSGTASGSPSRAREATKVNLQLGCDVIGGFPEDMGLILIVIFHQLKHNHRSCGHVHSHFHNSTAWVLARSIFSMLHWWPV